MAEEQQQQQQAQAGWLAGLPADLRDNDAFKPYKTVGDFAKAHLEAADKAKKLEERLEGSVLKLPENATQEERDVYLDELGRPESWEGYKLAGDAQSPPEVQKAWKQKFHELGFTENQAQQLSAFYDQTVNALVDKFKADRTKAIADSATKLKAEFGDKYDANIQLATRLWKQYADGDLEKDFAEANSTLQHSVIRYIVKMAAKTGEDTSQTGSTQRSQATPPRMVYDKSNMPPARA